MNALPDVCLVLNDRRDIVYASPSAGAVFGVPHLALTGHPLLERVYIDDRAKVASWLSMVRRGGGRDMLARLGDSDGSGARYELRGARLPRPLETHVLIAARNVGRRARALDGYVLSPSAWSAMCDLLQEGVVAATSQGSVAYANHAACALFGVSFADPVGAPLARFLVLDDFPTAYDERQWVESRSACDGPGALDGPHWVRLVGLGEPAPRLPVQLLRIDDESVPQPLIVYVLLPADRHAHTPCAARQRPSLHPLSPRELDVLHMLADGLDVREISAELDISINTTRFYVKSLFRKLGVRTQLQAVVFAARAGLLELRESNR
jgi:DNA-binding CsgD family transcriptional regulator/PAS domain-containing protein